MRLMIVTWLYEPHATPRAIRWKTVARELVRLGCEVDIVTSRGPGESEFEIVGGVGVHRCGGSTAARASAFAKDKGSAHPVASLLKRVHRSTWKRLYWPDKACLWARPATRTAERLLAQRRYDGLITVSLPFTAHVVGDRLKRKHPDLPWLVDVGDPFSCQDESAPNNVKLHGRRNREWESRVFQHADKISITNAAMEQVYGEIFPAIRDKYVVIPPVLGADVPKPVFGERKTAPKRLLFLGTLYRNIRNPRYLLEAFEQLPSFCELHIIGDVHDCGDLVDVAQKRIGNRLTVTGSQPRAEAMKSLADSDFLVNIGNTTPFQLPSKLAEYAAMGKHIVNISSCDRDSSTLFLEDYPGALHIRETEQPTPSDVTRLRKFIEDPPEIVPSAVEPWLRRSSPNSVTEAYLNAMNLRTPLRRAA